MKEGVAKKSEIDKTIEKEEQMREFLKSTKKIYQVGLVQTKILRYEIGNNKREFKFFAEKDIEVAKYIYNKVESNYWLQAFEALGLSNKEVEVITTIMNAYPQVCNRKVSLCGGMFIVPIANNNSHSYTLNLAYLVAGEVGMASKIGIWPDGEHGNSLPRDIYSIEAATDEQILDWVKKSLACAIQRIANPKVTMEATDFMLQLGSLKEE